MAWCTIAKLKVLACTAWRASAVVLTLTLSGAFPEASAKGPSLAAIELYDGTSGAAYVQLTDVLINGKTELRDCSAAPGTVDKSNYGKMAKVTLAVGGILTRAPDGVLLYSLNGAPGTCVVPMNLNFEHNARLSLSDLAEQAVLKANIIAPASGDLIAAIPQLKKGVKIVFVAVPNFELAEYLRAQRASDIESWRGFIAKHSASPHLADAKLALALLYVTAGEASLKAYQRSVNMDSPKYSDLSDSKATADLANSLLPTLDTTATLLAGIRTDLEIIIKQGRAELSLYRKALSTRTVGYIHLQNAKRLGEAVISIDPAFPAGLDLVQQTQKENNAYDLAMRSAATLTSVKQQKEIDRAFVTLQPYLTFVTEEPRLKSLLDAIYTYYMDCGAAAGMKLDWAASLADYERARLAKDTPEVVKALESARAQYLMAQDRAAATAAQVRSQALELQQDYIRAYEVLSVLSPSQQQLVSEDLSRLKPLYIESAAQKAADLRKVHEPIRGVGDGDAIENAYSYLRHAYDLSKDDTYADTMSLLGDELSTYFLAQGKHYLEKPEGSGTELGWAYLQEALSFKASNQALVRDARVGAEQAHAMHSKISIQVQFRDGTSQRDSQGFANQLENAIVTGLETSSIPVKAIRFGDSTTVKPDYQLIGDVIEHHVSQTPNPVSMDSSYFTGFDEVPNEAWSRANREYETATIELQTALSSLQGASAKGNKKSMEDWANRVEVEKRKVAEAHTHLDSIAKSIKMPINQPYTYTKNTIDYKNTVKLTFRIGETLNGQMTEFIPVIKEEARKVVILEGVKAEDSKGIKPLGAPLDVNEMRTGLENAARDALIESVRARVEALPKSIYQGAYKKEQDGDSDGAAEAYLRYLNCADKSELPERKHARAYIQSELHLRVASGDN